MTASAAEIRASDSDRQQIAERLNVSVGEGRLNLDEFSDRVAAAYAARTRGQLDLLVKDLPAASSLSTTTAARVPVAPAPTASLTTKVGAIKRAGLWRLAPVTNLGVVAGPIKLDLRGAQLTAPEVTISARTVFGAIKVWVPRGVRVDVEGATTMGTRTIEESNLPPDASVPTLRLRLDTVVGTVKVYRT